MADVTLDELKTKAAALVKRVEGISNEADPEKFQAIAKEIEAEAKAFEALGNRYVAEQRARTAVTPIATVVLTAEQRKKILAETGVAMETLELPDDGLITSLSMPTSTRDRITKLAIEEAQRRKAKGEAEKKALAQINDAIADLEAVGNPELMAMLEKNKENPNFLGGLLYKKK
jgi:hypothetical protein